MNCLLKKNDSIDIKYIKLNYDGIIQHMEFKINERIIFKTFSYIIMNTKNLSYHDSNNSLMSKYIRNEKNINISKKSEKTIEYALKYQKYRSLYGDKVLDFLFYHDNDVVGYAYVFFKGTADKILQVKKSDAYISQIEVIEEYRGNGYSKEMFSCIFDELRNRGAQEVFLAVNPQNEIAIKLYKKMGFEYSKKITYLRICGKNVPFHSI